MAELLNLSQTSEEVKAKLRAKGVDPEDAIFQYDDATGEAKMLSKKEMGSSMGLLKTLAGEAVLNVGPSLVGTAAGAGAAALAGTGTLPLGPVAIPTATAAGVLTAIPAGIGTAYLQDKALERFAPDIATGIQARRMANPRTATLGQILGGFSAGANSLRGLMTGGAKAAAVKAAVPVGLGGGLEAFNEYTSEGTIDPVRVGAAGLGGLLQIKPTPAGEVAEDIGRGLAGKIKNLKSPAPPVITRSMAEISRDIVNKWNEGTLTEGSPEHKQFAEEVDQPDASLDQLLKVADKQIQADLRNNPDSREEVATRLWEALKVKNVEPSTLPDSALEKQYAELIQSGDVASIDELRRLARAPNLTSELNTLRREKLDAAGPQPLKPGERMTDEQIQILLDASPDADPPNQSPLDKAVLEGKKAGYVHSVSDVRRLEQAYNADPALLPNAARTLWDEAEMRRIGPTAEDAAAAIQARDTEFFTEDFPKEVTALKKEQSQISALEKAMEKSSLFPEEAAIYQKRIAAARESLNQKWKQLFDKATEKYAESSVPPKPFPGEDSPSEVPPVKPQGPKPPKLTPIQQAGLLGPQPKSAPTQTTPQTSPPASNQTDTPEFKKWFGESKVVDESGKPLIVYHGTPVTAPIDSFTKTGNNDYGYHGHGFYFSTDPKIATNYAQDWSNKSFGPTYPAYVSLKNPATDAVMQKLFPKYALYGKFLNRDEAIAATELLKSKGYDGVYVKQGALSAPEVVVFDPTQIKSATGNRGTFDPKDPDIRHGGIPQATARNLGKLAAWLPDKLVVKPLFEGIRIKGRTQWSGTKPLLDRIRSLGPSGEVVADLDYKITTDSRRVFNTAATMYADAFNSLNPSETKRVNRYLNETFDNDGNTFITLTTKEQAAVDNIRRGLMYLVNNGVIRGGPGVREGAMYRGQQINPNYLPSIMDSAIRRRLQTESNEATKQLRADWESWFGQKLNLTPDEAAVLLTNYLEETGRGALNDAAKFGALTKAEGVGLPPSFRADPRTALLYHAGRASKNFAWFTHVQQNPAAAKVLGEMDDGWGNVIDFSNIPLDTLSGNAAVQAWKKEINGSRSADDHVVNSLNRIATTLQLGPLTGLRDLIGTPAHMAELIGGNETGLVVKALNNVVTSDVRSAAEKSGAIRAHTAAPFEWQTSMFTDGLLDRVLEQIRHKTGRNLLESTARQWAYETGRLVGAARIAKGDFGIFEHLKIPEWRSMTPEQQMEAVGNKFVEHAQGNYSSGGLPPYLLNSSDGQVIKTLFSLQRWGVERFNNWYKNAWRPAADNGNFKPLLKSVLGAAATGSLLNVLQELITEQKPQELTWKEYLRADNKEHAYTLFSKLQNVGFAGIFSQMGLAATQLANKEIPNSVNNLGIDLVAKLATRLGQAVQAVGDGAAGTDILGDFLDTVARDNIQIWRLMSNRHRPDTGMREERIYNRQMGKGNYSSSAASLLSNPMSPTSDLRKADNAEDAKKALPKVGRALLNNPELTFQPKNPMRRLYEGPGKPSYYDFVGQLQGPQAAQSALQRDQELQQLSMLKKQAVQTLKWQAQIGAGPQ